MAMHAHPDTARHGYCSDRKSLCVRLFLLWLFILPQTVLSQPVVRLFLLHPGADNLHNAENPYSEHNLAFLQDHRNASLKKEPPLPDAGPLRLSGYTQIRFRAQENRNSSFDIRMSRINLRGRLNKHIVFRLQTELGGTQQKLLDAELTFTLSPAFHLTVGQFKIPFSLENLMSSSRLQTVYRSQSVEALTARNRDIIGHQHGRDIGCRLHGTFLKIGDRDLFEYALGIFNGSGINRPDKDDKKDIAVRLAVKPIQKMTIACAFYSGHTTPADVPDTTIARKRMGAEFFYQSGTVTLAAEMIQGSDAGVKRAGWYVMFGYFFIPGKIQGILKFDTYDTDLNISGNTSAFTVLGLKYIPHDQASIIFNYAFREDQGGNESDNELTMQFQFAF